MSLPPLVLVHGAFCGGWVFDDFAEPFRAAGRQVIAPDLPGHGADQSRGAAAGLSMRNYADAIVAEAARLPTPPVLVGHSLGGLVSLLAAVKIQTAGVILLAPSAPWGVGGSTMEEAVSAVGLLALGPYWATAIEPDYPMFRRYGVNRLERSRRRAIFSRMRPESGRAIFETLNWWLDPFMTTHVDAARIKAPILAIAGGRDVVHPVPTVAETARRLGASFQVAPQMSHWLVGEPEWREVADRCLDWLAGEAPAMAAE